MKRRPKPTTYGTEWVEAFIQVRRFGDRYELGLNKIVPAGDQHDHTITITREDATALAVFWGRPKAPPSEKRKVNKSRRDLNG